MVQVHILILMYYDREGANRGLINYIDTKAKCHHLKKFPCKGILRKVFIRVYRLVIQSVIVEGRVYFGVIQTVNS